jgi:hypothetical protein
MIPFTNLHKFADNFVISAFDHTTGRCIWWCTSW